MAIKVIIASLNPVKINAVKEGFGKMFPAQTFSFHGVNVTSNVSAQPMSDSETFEGASNRASNAMKVLPDADYWVGIEGGVEQKGSDMEAFAWIIIKSTHGDGMARTSTFFLPDRVVELINEGKELGDADDIVFGQSNSKQQNGAVGILTGNVVDRTSYYTQAVILALIKFKNSSLYK